ncbi:MAG: hypothetical protein CL431_05015 [Acidimicrobiaceae bacterium]|nr:hypothetical protein [Acidimicrobiaceae bacterium]
MTHRTIALCSTKFLLSSLSALLLLIGCSTEDMVFEPSQQAIEEESSQDARPADESTPENDQETPVFIPPTPVIPSMPPASNVKLDELDCANPKQEIKFHWGTDLGDGFENSIYGPYLLKDARTGVHADYDRFVLEFDTDPNEPDGSPDSFQLFWATDSPTSMGSGEPIPVLGNYALEIFVLGYGYARNESAEPSQAPNLLSPTRTGNLKQAISDGEFEGVLHWVLGTEEKTDFRVLSISNPPRLVVDVCRSSVG